MAKNLFYQGLVEKRLNFHMTYGPQTYIITLKPMKGTPQVELNEIIIWMLHPLVVSKMQ